MNFPTSNHAQPQKRLSAVRTMMSKGVIMLWYYYVVLVPRERYAAVNKALERVYLPVLDVVLADLLGYLAAYVPVDDYRHRRGYEQIADEA